ncbi:S41 family peptidase [Bacteroidota bacterium]
MHKRFYFDAFIYIVITVSIISSNIIYSQDKNGSEYPYIPLLGRHLKPDEIFIPEKPYKKPGRYTNTDWAELIDQTWGAGMSTTQKLAIFDRAWELLDFGYGAFVNRDVDMIALRNRFRPMIEAGVSRGKFAAIMNHLSMEMQDGHTFITNIPVTWGTQPQPGVPLFVVSGANDNSRFGAVLTLLEDDRLLVLKVLPNHVLNLQPGDIILGYDGVPWNQLYHELIDAMLPMQQNYTFGSTEESMHDVFMRSAGLNWHLFDTIDIQKYGTGEIQHLPTSLLQNQTGFIWGNEQLDIPGVTQPDFPGTDHITWGIINGTSIGYIYAGSWLWYDEYNISEDFYNAVYEFQIQNNTSGLIIDMRLNYGGSMVEADEGYELLFNETIYNIGFKTRSNANDHLAMTTALSHPSSLWVIRGDASTFYDRPIAVLTGPSAVSNGDWESVRLGWHPMARVFGKPTNGAFTISDYPDLQNIDWYFYRATGSGYLFYDQIYMAHTSAPIDEIVWFTPEDAANGTDTVVERAIEWINNTTTGVDDQIEIPEDFYLSDNYPNPFNPSTNIQYKIPHETYVNLTIYNSLGQVVKTLVDETQHAGYKTVKWDGTNSLGKVVGSGVYFYKLQADTFIETKKMLLLK